MDTHEAMATQMDAWERLERAQTEVQIAEISINALVIGAPLRYGVAATDRLRRADAELAAARASYEAAQDVECPEI